MNRDKYMHLVYMVAERLEGGTWKGNPHFTVMGIERLGNEDNAVPKLSVEVRQIPEVGMEKSVVVLLADALAGTAGFRSGVEFEIESLRHVDNELKGGYIELILRALEVDEEAGNAEEAEDA
jgi:hypothetical protein